MNKKGDVMSALITILVMVFVLVILVVGWFAYSLLAPPLVTTIGTVSDQLINIPESSVSNYSNATIGNISRGLNRNIEWFSYFLLIGSFLGFILIAFFVRTYPIMSVFYIGFMVVLIICSIYLSNSYMAVADSGTSTFYQQYPSIDFLMRNLPYILTAEVLIGGVVMFILIGTSEVEYGL